MNIYEISNALSSTLAELDFLDNSPDATEQQKRALRDTFDLLEGDFRAKVKGYCYAMRNYEYKAQACKAEAAKLKERAAAALRAVEHMKGVLYWAMVQAENPKVDAEIATVSIRKPSERLELDDGIEEIALSWHHNIFDDVVEERRVVSKTALKEKYEKQIRDGELRGVRFVQGEPGVTIRPAAKLNGADEEA